MLKTAKTLVLLIFFSILLSPVSFAKTPQEVLVPYKAYRAALDKGDNKTAKDNALKAWEAAEKHLGEHKTTGDLAINYANIEPGRKEKNRYKNYEKRAKAYNRGIKLSSLYTEKPIEVELERRIALANLEFNVKRNKNSALTNAPKKMQRGKLGPIVKIQKVIETNNLRGSTFDGDLQVLFARYYQLNGNPQKAIEYGGNAIRIYENRSDGYFSKYAYFIHIFKGNSHIDLANKIDDIDEKIKAALEFQVVMQNLEGGLSANHPFVKTAFSRWLKTRSDIEEAGMLKKAEEAGLCECWPYENYKDKAVPLKRVPPKMPSSARRSGHVFVKFDVNDNGKPVNIVAVSSSNEMFEKSAIKSVENWEYSKLQTNTDSKNRKNITTKMTYRLTDRSGNTVPE